MKELRDFGKALLAHVANDNKTAKARVEASYHAWAAKQDEIDNLDYLTSQHYRVTVDQPRNEKIQAYEDYLLQKSQLWEAWKISRHDQRAAILHEIFGLQLPEFLEEGIQQNVPVYTKNVQVL